MNSIIIFCAKYLFILVILIAGVAWLRAKGKDGKVRFAVATILAGVIALALAKLASALYFDPRPFVSEHVTPLISHAPDNGFPSDHALFTMTLTAAVYFFNKKAAGAMLLFTIIVGIARILAKVHSPLDIGAGWVIGIIGATAGYYAGTWLAKRYNQRRKPQGDAA